MTVRKASLDVRLKDFFADPYRYADIVNGTMFGGRQVLDPLTLSKYHTDISTIISDEDTANDSIEGYRDMMMESQSKGIFILIGIENQNYIDSAIALRNLVYNSGEYNLQYREYQKLVREKKKPGKLRIKPVFTPVIYYGDKKWKRKVRLSELMDIPEEMAEKFNDWETEIYDVKEMDIERFKNRDNRQLIDALKRIHRCKKEGMEILKGLVLTKEIALIVATITDNEKLMKYIEVEEEKEEVNMYESLRLLYAEADATGEARGRVVGEAIGEARGKAIGELSGMVKTVLTFLRKRVGGLSKETEERIRNSSTDKLNNFVERMDEVKAESDIKKYLG